MQQGATNTGPRGRREGSRVIESDHHRGGRASVSEKLTGQVPDGHPASHFSGADRPIDQDRRAIGATGTGQTQPHSSLTTSPQLQGRRQREATRRREWLMDHRGASATDGCSPTVLATRRRGPCAVAIGGRSGHVGRDTREHNGISAARPESQERAQHALTVEPRGPQHAQ
jgi:hypothetical protein